MTRAKPPDIDRILRETPHAVDVRYKGTLYKWRQCGWDQCGKWFWKAHTDGCSHNANAYRVYCCDEHRQANWRVLATARQRRWRARKRLISRP